MNILVNYLTGVTETDPMRVLLLNVQFYYVVGVLLMSAAAALRGVYTQCFNKLYYRFLIVIESTITGIVIGGTVLTGVEWGTYLGTYAESIFTLYGFWLIMAMMRVGPKKELTKI